MKKTIALLLCLCMLACLFVGCASTSTTENPTSETTTTETTASETTTAASGNKVLKVGIFEPLTGDNGAGGKQETLGAQYGNYVQPTIEIGGETYDIQLEIVDNRTTAENGPSAASELVNRGVSVVLGSYGSGVSMAGGKVFEEAGIPAIGIGCTNPQVTSDCSVYFRVCFLDPFQGSVMASFAMEEFGAKKAYVLSMLGDDYTVGLAKNFVIAFEAAGGEIVADETFVEGTADFSAYLNNAVAGGADVIFAPSAIAYAPQIIEQASALGISLPILGGDTWENSAISDAQNGTDMQVFVSTFFDENDESGLAKEFVTGYKAWLNGNSQNLTNNGGNDVVAAVSALGYDAYMTAVAAIEKAQSTDGSAIRDALAGLSIDAVTGSISFDANGDAIKSTAYIKQAIDGGFQFYKVQNAD